MLMVALHMNIWLSTFQRYYDEFYVYVYNFTMEAIKCRQKMYKRYIIYVSYNIAFIHILQVSRRTLVSKYVNTLFKNSIQWF